MGAIAKVFWTGRSQAIRIPREFRIDADSVRIRRDGDRLVIEPIPPVDALGWPVGLFDRLAAGADPEFSVGERDLPLERRPDLE